MLQVGRARRDLPAEQPLRPGRGLGPPAARACRSRSSPRSCSFYVIDAYQVARETGMGGRINTIMQTCFFAISGVLPRDEAIAAIKHAIEKTYGKRGEAVVQQELRRRGRRPRRTCTRSPCPARVTSTLELPPAGAGRGARVRADGDRPDDRRRRRPPAGQRAAGRRHLPDRRPRSGRSATSPLEIPVWDAELCIQCGKCVLVCPHAAIRAKVYDAGAAWPAPRRRSSPRRPAGASSPDQRYTLQVAPEDCTGCALCVEVCPAKNKTEVRHKAINMAPQPPLRDAGGAQLGLLPRPARDRTARALNPAQVKDVQLLQPLFEFSGACAGCGETPYLKLLTPALRRPRR